MKSTTLIYNEGFPIDRERFAEMVADLQQHGARFQVERRDGSLIIRLESEGGGCE